MVSLLWTSNTLPLSKLIRWGLGGKASHFVFVFSEKQAYHSNLMGPHVQGFKSFLRKNQVVHRLDLELGLEKEDEAWSRIVDKIEESDAAWYDFGGFFFFFYRAVLFKFFKVPFPKKNLWGQSDKYICLELIPPVLEWLEVECKDIDFAIMTPEASYLLVFEKLKEKGYIK